MMSPILGLIGLGLCAVALPLAVAEDDIQETLEAVNRKLIETPNDPALLVQRSQLYTLKSQYDLAVADLNQADKIGGLPTLQYEKAKLFLTAGWNETGLEHANRYVAANPNDYQGYLVRARLLAKLDRLPESANDYFQVIEKNRDTPLEIFIEGAKAVTTEDGTHLPLALKMLDQGISRIGSIVTLQSAALEAEIRQSNWDAALARVDKITQQMPRKDSWLAKRGDILVKAGRYDEARKTYQSALDAIQKLGPNQRRHPDTIQMEKQLKELVLSTTDLAGRSTVPDTKLLQKEASSPQLAPQFAVAPTNRPVLGPHGKVRTYYIAAEELEWDYAPQGNVLQEPFCGDPDALPGALVPNRIGMRYRKSIYREYMDSSFQRLKVRSGHWRHLGMLGPLLRAEVGDEIRIVFKNRTRYPASMHPHGVFYLKTSEGSGYNDQTAPADKTDDAVPPGKEHTYEWFVTEEAGPGPADGSSVVWLYHSHVHAPKDGNAGLIGAMIVTAQGKAHPDGTPSDVDREFVTLFNIYDENQSWHFESNLKQYLGSTNVVRWDDRFFLESNMKHAINGYVFGNLPLLSMYQNERVRWYLLGMGSEPDLHTSHWHGNTVLHHGRRTDVVDLLPAAMKVADMRPKNLGIWMYHCHVNDHMLEGMSARYQVLAGSDTTQNRPVDKAVANTARASIPPSSSAAPAK
jgi:tetratricopeptide (TPR) repeat protein